MSDCCRECGEELYPIDRCTDRDGMRKDLYCAECHVLYGSRSHGLVKLKGNDWNKKQLKSALTHALRILDDE